jgi:hypothetical protein
MEIFLENIKIIHSGIFTPIKFGNQPPRYKTTFRYEGPLLIEQGVFPRSARTEELPFYATDSSTPAAVHPRLGLAADYCKLNEYIATARNLNINPDLLFRNMVVDATFKIRDHPLRERFGYLIAMKEIFIGPEELKHNLLEGGSL